MTYTQFLVNRNDIHNTEVVAVESPPEVNTGEVLLAIDQFAFTANNVTYAAFGDVMKYWDFFPAADGHGCVPVWGFADVVESRCDGVAVGERFYGYYPMATHLRTTPAKASPAGFFDAAPHRAHLSAIYNYYTNTATDPGYSKNGEDIQMIFKPLFMTSFLIDDFLEDNAFYGAKQIVLSSASSKTAYGLAFLLAQREGIKVIGLTSAGNMDFVEGLGSYDHTVTYDAVDTLDASVPTVYVDMAGSCDVRSSVHKHFNDNLKYSCSVGASHWDKMGANDGLPGAKPTLFFAPAQAKKRSEDWGQDGLMKRSAKAWLAFTEKADSWTTVVHETGSDAVGRVYRDTLEGKASPKNGYILKF